LLVLLLTGLPENTVGYASRTFSSGSGESHPKRYAMRTKLWKNSFFSTNDWHPHRPKEAVIPDFSGVSLRCRFSRVPLIVRNLLRELSLYAASVSKALGWLVIATLPEW
jgi:hypothetical protein